MTTHRMSSEALSLLAKLQDGPRQTETNAYPGEQAFSHFARLFFNNAEAVARTDGWDDFVVFGALYQLRHGLELWLKCVARDEATDAFLARVFTSNSSLEELTASLPAKSERIAISRALCVLRNYRVDKVKAPRCWQVRMESCWAEKGLEYLRANPETPRYQFAHLHHAPLPTHNLMALWKRAEPRIVEFQRFLPGHYARTGQGNALAPEKLEALCTLLTHFDPDGDAFRYPASLDGEWRTGFPIFSLDRLAELSYELNWSVCTYSSLREELYVGGTVAHPRCG